MKPCDLHPRNQLIRLSNRNGEFAECGVCGRFFGYYDANSKPEKKTKQIIETTIQENRKLLIGHDGIGD